MNSMGVASRLGISVLESHLQIWKQTLKHTDIVSLFDLLTFLKEIKKVYEITTLYMCPSFQPLIHFPDFIKI
jgi:hypothetical protein